MFTRISCRNTLIHRRPRTFEVAYPTSKRRAAELDCGLRISLRIGFQSAIRSPQSEILPPGPYEREIERFESNLSIQIIDQGSSELLHSFDRGNDCRDRKRTCQCLKLLSDIDLPYERETRGQSRRPEAGSQPDRAKAESFPSPSPARRPLGLFERIRRARKAV